MILTIVKSKDMIKLTNVEMIRMNKEKKLPDTELEVMTAIWHCEIPVKTAEIARHIDRDWTMSHNSGLISPSGRKGIC